MRWRTQREVLCGKGQFACGAKGCEAGEGLCSYEVNFAYVEAGERKQALVKLRVCPACACKLNYKKEKQLQKAVDAAAARKRKREAEEEKELEGQDPRVRAALQYVQRFAEGGAEAAERGAEEGAGAGGFSAAELERAARDVAAPPGAAAAAAAAGVGSGGGGAAPAVILLPADNSVWEAKAPQESSTVEDEMDSYFEGLFL
ncbi:Protein FRA10AC1 [Tetrabaena socialis]|uniref:Protein FRA10AC1 n=1 Tax=Tetrabaena socialis TaxID=47790 RepID=A0A2J7ZUP9_9CHLO|nr:Protein FRA10AC1 [Tetrabaena socialis]|eukprot:PNH03978.1 Protein FRA10AC1 [Tetrabaena socialis]